jgi:hypothetical protein
VEFAFFGFHLFFVVALRHRIDAFAG